MVRSASRLWQVELSSNHYTIHSAVHILIVSSEYS